MWWLLACTPKIPPEAEGSGWSVRYLDAGPGLSGLTVDGEGRLWAVAERPSALVRLDDGHTVTLGLPAEPESVAWTPEGFWIGTESPREREADWVFRVSPAGEVLERRTYTYEGVVPQPNHGLEGLCIRDGQPVVAAEDPDERRRAPVAMVPGETRWLQLRSETGKVSGLACDDRHLYAIERHYDVLQILRAPWSDLEASEVLDVPAAGRGSRVNYEGLALHEGRLILLSDNQGATVDGPTVLLSIDRL